MLEKRIENIGDVLSARFEEDYLRLDAIKDVLLNLGVTKVKYEVFKTLYGRYNDKLVEKKIEEDELVVKDAPCNEKVEIVMNSDYSKTHVRFELDSDASLTEDAKSDLKKLCSILFVFIENKELHNIIKKDNRTLVDGAVDGKEYIVTAIEYINKYRENDYLALIVSINNFDGMNRLYGELVGEDILRSYANELVNITDDDELVAHRINEKFALLIKRDNLDKILKVLDNCKINQMIDNKEVAIGLTATAGISEVNYKNANVDTIVLEPRWAITYARTQGAKTAKVTDELREKILLQRRIEDGFAEALEKEYIKLWFQPKIDIRDDTIVGVEALARWIEPDVTYMPGDFIPVLEEAGLITDLDFFVLEKACKYISKWQKLGNVVVPLSLNFSRRNLSDSMLPVRINNILEKYNIDKKNIIIEITETASENMKNQLSFFLEKMRAFGIQTSVDDFGTGYASLAMLRDFELDEIKVDRSFISAPFFNHKNKVILVSILRLAKSLGMKVIVEGVETEAQKQLLKEVGVNYVQGFLYDKPLPRLEFEDRLINGY